MLVSIQVNYCSLYVHDRFFKYRYNASSSLIVDMFRNNYASRFINQNNNIMFFIYIPKYNRYICTIEKHENPPLYFSI